VLAQKPKHEIKFAALAPKGSTWMNLLEELDVALREASDGELGFTIYAGGVAGDELKVLRKMRIGQLHAAGLTGVGLGQIVPEERILDTPFLFRDSAEVDYVLARISPDLEQRFLTKGYVLLGWAEVGFVYLYSNTPVNQYSDLKNLNMWVWESDPVAKEAFSTLDLKPIPLSFTDVVTSLQSGIINAVYTSPLAAVSLQWYTRVDFMLDVPIANAMGAVIIDARTFKKLPPAYQDLLQREAAKYLGKITAASRLDNAKSLTVMEKNGVQIIREKDAEDLQLYREAGAQARQNLAGEYYSAELLARVEALLAEYRQKSSEDQ
jgi:TRAP-type C4-dicarboxylate transport system substrate-binding protein